MQKIIFLLFLVIFTYNGNAQIDSIANNLPQVYEGDFIASDDIEDAVYAQWESWDDIAVNVYLEFERLTNMPVWDCQDLENAYYIRLDYLDLLVQIGSTENRYIGGGFSEVMLWCAIMEMDIFERYNEEQ